MELVLYQCDLCKKEHRRSDKISVMIYKDGILTDARFYELCSECENSINAMFKTLTK